MLSQMNFTEENSMRSFGTWKTFAKEIFVLTCLFAFVLASSRKCNLNRQELVAYSAELSVLPVKCPPAGNTQCRSEVI